MEDQNGFTRGKPQVSAGLGSFLSHLASVSSARLSGRLAGLVQGFKRPSSFFFCHCIFIHIVCFGISPEDQEEADWKTEAQGQGGWVPNSPIAPSGPTTGEQTYGVGGSGEAQSSLSWKDA